jgi:hypothetical protein
MVIERRGFTIIDYHLTVEGACPHCGTKIPGVWPQDPKKVNLGGFRMPKPIY